MDEAKELKQAYDIFTAAWRIYKAHYPPKDLKDDSYWSELAGVIEKTEANRGSDRGDKPYKNFGVVAGAGFVYFF